ncbi:MFS transporter [Paenibacillus daejeonensis]|uniref:MFS transporter n=1 Tax=Paenibacillus daejeonensis TaxID=135193 RepID=UPI00037D25D0|nr:MFS transporter [Paenibacillus daejeonensis]
MKRIVLTGTVFIAITYALGRFSYGLFMPEISAALRLSEASSGSIASMAYAGYCLALLTASSLVRWGGGRGTLQLAGVCVLLGLLLIGTAGHGLSLAVGLALTGLSSGWASPAYGEVVHSGLQPEQHGRGNAWINSGTSWGLVVLGPIAYFFSAEWRFAYLGFAVLAALAILMQWRLLPQARAQENRSAPGVPSRLWRTGGRLMGAAFAVGAASAVYWTFARSMWQAWHGLTGDSAAFLWLLMGVSGILGGFAGVVVERFGQGAAYRWGVGILMLSICGITLSGLPVLMLSAILFGIAYIFLTGIFIVWGTRCFPRHAAFGISLAFLMLGVGQFGGSMAAGVLIEATSYAVAFLSFGLFGLAGLAIRPTVPRSD